MELETIQKAASSLTVGRLELARMDVLPREIRPVDEPDAYCVQGALHTLLSDAGLGSVCGYKIGCTTPVMQRFLDINNPCAGAIFDSTIHELSGSFKFDKLLHPGVECEIAIRLKSDISPTDAPHNKQSVASAVGSVMAAIEIVDDRWVDYTSVDTPTLIADDFFGAGCVLGPEVLGWEDVDLSGVKGSMSINGTQVGSGMASDIMGHPLEALAWIANSMSVRGKCLRTGEFVLLGSLVETKWVTRGDIVTIEEPGLGAATARFI
ncbi:MAG: fumarylacetoacetate hydrolase family protein [SAR202 cluster bacterium]|jgi:2-oxo-3-hexenedioate decarboxylase/2-keto-4-pentenoate hydratase|nr:fumarylacetoacetate hydrolase family protein [SAR202 cluster bacterium]